jgi:hypothetical protein
MKPENVNRKRGKGGLRLHAKRADVTLEEGVWSG